jgi:hypothetical protein
VANDYGHMVTTLPILVEGSVTGVHKVIANQDIMCLLNLINGVNKKINPSATKHKNGSLRIYKECSALILNATKILEVVKSQLRRNTHFSSSLYVQG